MKVKTLALREVLNVVSKGASFNKMIPLTQMIGIKNIEDGLSFYATDSTTYISMKMKVENVDPIDCCVNCDLLTKLINKFECEDTEIVFENSYLTVKGDGEYHLEYLPDENGKPFSFPLKMTPSIALGKVKVEDIFNIKTNNEKSLATTMEEPALVGYYFSTKKIISTDTAVMTINNLDLGLKEDLILRSKFIDLLALMSGEISLYKEGKAVSANTDRIEVISSVNCDLEDYPTDSINGVLESAQFNSEAKIKTKTLVNILDRLSLFVSNYDGNVINVKIDGSNAFISTKKSKGVEILPLVPENDPLISYECSLDIEMLKTQLSTFTAEEIKFSFGNDTFIRLSNDNISKLVCLIDED